MVESTSAETAQAAKPEEGASEMPDTQVEASSNRVDLEQGTGRRLVSVLQPKLRLVWSGFGPSTVVRQFNSYILSTVGCTLFVYRYDGTGLEQVSFFRAQVRTGHI